MNRNFINIFMRSLLRLHGKGCLLVVLLCALLFLSDSVFAESFVTLHDNMLRTTFTSSGITEYTPVSMQSVAPMRKKLSSRRRTASDPDEPGDWQDPFAGNSGSVPDADEPDDWQDPFADAAPLEDCPFLCLLALLIYTLWRKRDKVHNQFAPKSRTK